MNFLFVDQILSLDPGKKAVGIKHVSPQDMYLTAAPNGKPALLPCIVGEALGQLNSWCAIVASDFKLRSIGGIVPEVNMNGFAYLGDTVLLEIEIDHLDDEAINWRGKASVHGQTIFSVESIGPCVPMEEFNDPEEVRCQYAMVNRPGPIPEAKEGRVIIPESLGYYSHLTSYDKILEWEKGSKVVAQKNISLIAPYFADHFPRKPVLPITLLLQSKLQLAMSFLTDFLGEERAKQFFPSKFRNIKMNDFVLPGQSIITKMQLKEQSDEKITLSFRSEVDGRRVCVAQADFTLNNV